MALVEFPRSDESSTLGAFHLVGQNFQVDSLFACARIDCNIVVNSGDCAVSFSYDSTKPPSGRLNGGLWEELSEDAVHVILGL